MVTSAYELRKKFRLKKQKDGFKKTCHLCGKELIIKKEDVLYMIDEKTVHMGCFIRRKK